MYEFVLVAEKSVVDIIPHVVRSLNDSGQADKIIIICPANQVDLFRNLIINYSFEVIAEDLIISQWDIARVKSRLGKFENRAGWYYQQFLKLAYCSIAEQGRYVIWDADTVCLDAPIFEIEGKFVFTPSRERHEPYYSTLKKLTGSDILSERSFISQYMVIDTTICREMLSEIATRSKAGDWIDAIMSCLPLDCQSEFSEYETYGNYMLNNYPDRVVIANDNKWFRFGSDVLDIGAVSYEDMRRRFLGYKFVAFERHPHSLPKRLRALLFLVLGVST